MSAQPTDRNVFLAELSPADYELFRPHLTSFVLNVGDRLQDLGAAVEQVVFPHSGLVAMTMPLRSGGDGAGHVRRGGLHRRPRGPYIGFGVPLRARPKPGHAPGFGAA